MRLALLSDAHGNTVGLKACLRHIEAMGVDDIYFLGDAVGYFMDPTGVLEALTAAGARCQKGNHEAMLLGQLPLDPQRDRFYQLSAQRESLSARWLGELSEWPRSRQVECGGVRLLLSHGSPAPSITERLHEDTEWAPPPDFASDVAFVGHTHRPWIRDCDGVQLINVGSCGMPRDRGDLAAFVVYDTAGREAQIYRAKFDVEEALRLHGAGVPPEVTEVFERRGEFHGTVL